MYPDQSYDLRHVEYPVPGTASYTALLSGAGRSGRCPFWVGLYGAGGSGDGDGPPSEVEARIGRVDPATVLDDWWPGPSGTGNGTGDRGPFPGGFPGLMEPAADRRPSRDAAVRCAADAADELGVVCTLAVAEAHRPADVPAVVGWSGSDGRPYRERAELSAVLRSWEDRFGAMLVLMTRTDLYLAVTEPPCTERECQRVAAEHIAFCPDRHARADGAERDLRSYARSIEGSGLWRFRWS